MAVAAVLVRVRVLGIRVSWELPKARERGAGPRPITTTKFVQKKKQSLF